MHKNINPFIIPDSIAIDFTCLKARRLTGYSHTVCLDVVPSTILKPKSSRIKTNSRGL